MSGCRCQPTTGAAAGTDGTPGHQLLGRGRISQVLAWEAGWVLKLFAPQVGREEVEREFGATRLAHRLGAPAPEVREVVEYLGRLGMVCRRVEGATLLQRPAALLRSGGRL
ncbi:MAG TPA: hypothetical protein DCM14_03735, partial [Clostridiales bacterium UBA8153]|nr:hypothetical protein [Clostridiales bacterium UBA8153]